MNLTSIIVVAVALALFDFRACRAELEGQSERHGLRVLRPRNRGQVA